MQEESEVFSVERKTPTNLEFCILWKNFKSEEEIKTFSEKQKFKEFPYSSSFC
jgi:hypothetical protein